MSEPTTTSSAPGFRDYMSYGVGMTGNQILRDVPTAMLLFFMTNALMISPAYAGFAILVPKFWVIVSDPLVGTMSDRTRSRWGARKPYLFAGAIVSFVSFVLLFNVPVPESHLHATILIGGIYLLLVTGYSMYSVPYLTLAAEIGDEPEQRTKALSYKQYCCLVGVFAGLSLAPWLIAQFGGGKDAYGKMAWIVGLIMLASMMTTALLAPVRAVKDTSEPASGNVVRQLREAFGHKPFRIVFSASALQLFGIGIGHAVGLYYLIYVLQLPMEVLGANIVGTVIGSALAQSLWVKLAGRIGTVPAYSVATIYTAVVSASILLLPKGEVVPYILFGVLSGSSASGIVLLSVASLIEAIALDGPDSPRKGLFASAYTAMEKAMIAVGGFAVAAVLAFAGFAQGRPLEEQPASAPLAIMMVSVVFPAVLKLVSVLILRQYPKSSAAIPAAALAR